MSQRHAVMKAIATRYKRADKAGKGRVLDELCATTGWHRNHARKALGQALKPRIVRPRKPRPPLYGAEVVGALRFCWAVLGAPTGKRLAPVLGELVPTLRRFGELDVSEEVAVALRGMSAATIDRRLAADRAKLEVRGHSHTKPGSLLKDSIPIRTWAQCNDAVPGFVEIDLVGHEGGNAIGDHAYTLTVTDIATGWTENRSVRNKAQKWVFAALLEIKAMFPFPIIGIDSDNGSEFINYTVAKLLGKLLIEQTKSRAHRSGDNGLVEAKNGAIIRKHIGFGHIGAPHAEAVNAFHRDHLNPYVNFHRPCAVPRVIVAANGKRRRIYTRWATPWELFQEAPRCESLLRPDATLAGLQQFAQLQSDTEAALEMQRAKRQLLNRIAKLSA